MLLRTFLLSILSFYTSLAIAGLEFCNRTEETIRTVIMAGDSYDVWRSHGWYSIKPEECITVISGNLNRRYYYFYAKRNDLMWSGKEGDPTGCIRQTRFTDIDSTDECEEGFRQVPFRTIDTGESTHYTFTFTYEPETLSFADPANVEKACSILHAQLDRPRLRTETIPIGHYTDLLTPPQTKTECTNTYDTGVPDPSTCSSEWDECAEEISLPFGGWTCKPGYTLRCSNIIACNTWATYKKTMECDVMVQLKLPNFIEKPLSRFIDNSFDVIEQTRYQVQTALPLQCAPPNVRQSVASDVGKHIAEEISRVLQKRIRETIEREAKEWILETGIKTVAASIPSGGVGGAAIMNSSLVQFVYRAHKALKPIVKMANDYKNTAEDLGFSTSCGWNDWHRAF